MLRDLNQPIRFARKRSSALTALFLIVAGATSYAQSTGVQVGRYHLQSNPWVNLHQRLLYEACFPQTPPTALIGDKLAEWKKAVEAYRSFVGKRSPIVDAELIRMNDTLSATNDSRPPDSIPKPALLALEMAMPLYRVAQWPEDDRANRFWIAVAEPLLASAVEELVQAHAKAYGRPFPTHILVDVTTFGWEFGAYTVGNPESAHVVIASVVPGNQGFAALEALMHEPSHAIVDFNSGAIGSDLTRAAAELGIHPPRSLWHALLFYTAGELTRRALAERGVSDYKPVVLQMYERGFAEFRTALETHWQAYLDGKLSREEAIRKILNDTAPAKK